MLVYFAALLSVAYADICCPPSQWQADVGIVMGTVNNGSTVLTEGSMRVSYDSINKIIGYDQALIYNGIKVNQRIVADFKNGFMYTIRDGECNQTRANQWVSACIPDNATLLSDKSIYGLGNNAVVIKAYKVNMQGLDINYAVTADSCVPVTETLTGKLMDGFGGNTNADMMQVLNYANVKGGIADRSVFFVPAQCESQATAQVVGRRSIFFR